jgi:signal transduction histidine kinase
MSADNSYKLLDNMLTWVKLQSGMLTVKPSKFNLNTAIENTLYLLRPALDTKKIDVKQNLNGTSEIFGEQNLISTILRNLINNAIKFSEIESEIDISVVDESDDLITISIQDFGIGMDDSTLQNLFNSEKRPQKDGTMNEKGSGLGLILVKELAELSEGSIKVESELGKGSTFTLTIPKKHNS